MLSYEPHAPAARLIMRNNASLHMYEYYPPCITGRVAGVDDDDDDDRAIPPPRIPVPASALDHVVTVSRLA